MDPVSASIGGFVWYLAKKIKDKKEFKDFASDFTKASINELRHLFLMPDDTPTDLLQKLQQNPDSEARRKAIESAIEIEVEDKPELGKVLQEMHEVIKKKENQGQTNTITNSNNVNTGTINSGGNVNFWNSNK